MVLIAGDLFEHDRVTPDTVEFLRHQFGSLGEIRVFVAPGNHDPFIQGSPYRENIWPANTHIFAGEEFQTVALPGIGVNVAGFGFTRAQEPDRIFTRLKSMPADAVNLVVCHASELSRIPNGKSCHGPFAIEEIAQKQVHYCALGHYHEQRRVDNPIDGTEVWYSGIPEGRGWDEEGDCAYIFGEIAGGKVSLSRRPCGQYPLRTLTLDCDDFTSREQIVDAIHAQVGSGHDARTILRVRLLGFIDPRLDLSTPELEARLAEEALQIFWEDQTQPALDFESVARENTLRGRFARTMNERIASAPEAERIVLERARSYGLQALAGEEIRLR